MIPKECKRLAEVDFPIAVVSKHSAREKSIRHGHPSTLHLWWARRPLAACRSMLLALLLPDPCDKHCPAEFKKQARKLLAKLRGSIDADDMGLREALLGFIGDFAAWEMASNATYLEISRGLVKAAHPEETPLVVDPFAGGGAIPLEALRLGCDAFASDLNPVACLINKVMLEDIPRYGSAEFTLKDNQGKNVTVHGLADALRHVGGQVRKAAEQELAEFYPTDPDGSRPIAYLWARTVRCESPNCGAEIPLVRSFWLCKKPGRKRALRFIGLAKAKQGSEPQFELFEPKADKDVPGGTVTSAKATCLHCGTVMRSDRVRAQLSAQRGGADPVFDHKGKRCGGARLLAVVTLRDREPGRHYRLASSGDYKSCACGSATVGGSSSSSWDKASARRPHQLGSALAKCTRILRCHTIRDADCRKSIHRPSIECRLIAEFVGSTTDERTVVFPSVVRGVQAGRSQLFALSLGT